MTKAEVSISISGIIRQAVIQSGGDAMRDYTPFVEQVFTTMGRLTPEPKEKPKVPEYNEKKVKRVGTLIQKHQFSEADRTAAVNALRAVGLL